MTCNSFSKFNFKKVTGYVVAHPQKLIAIGHTARVSPWSDPSLHQHASSEEYYLLLNGQLEFIVRDFQINLHPNELLMVEAGVPHAVVGGTGQIKHFGMRAPALDDKEFVGDLLEGVPCLFENERLVSGNWGHRIPLAMPQHKNCWLIGAGLALYKSQHLIMAYLNFPTKEAANAGIGTRHRLHLHQKSWKYYTVLKGEKILLIEDTLVAIHAGEILDVPPNVSHTIYSRIEPYRGFHYEFRLS